MWSILTIDMISDPPIRRGNVLDLRRQIVELAKQRSASATDHICQLNLTVMFILKNLSTPTLTFQDYTAMASLLITRIVKSKCRITGSVRETLVSTALIARTLQEGGSANMYLPYQPLTSSISYKLGTIRCAKTLKF